MSKLRVLIYGDYYQDNSGFAKEIRNMIPTMIEEGHEVAQVALNYSGVIPKNRNFKIYPTKLKGTSSYWAPEVLDIALDDFQPDILFSVCDYFTIPHIAAIASKPREKKTYWVNWGVVDGQPMRRQYAESAGWIDYNLTQSKFGAKILKEALDKVYGLSQAEVFYPPIDLDVFKPLNREPLRGKFKTEERFSILFVGRNQHRKNTPVLMEAVKKIRKIITNIQIVLHSTQTVTPQGIPEGYDLPALVENMDIEKNVSSVRAKGALTEEVMNEIYNAVDLLVLPSFGEGFGLPIAEAFAAGTPVIAANNSSMSELLQDGRGVLVNPVANIYMDGFTMHQAISSDDLANAIYKVWENPSLREKMIQNGKDFVKKLEAKSQTKKLLHIFESVINNKVTSIATRTEKV